MRLPAGMSSGSHFAASPQANIPRSSFNRSHGYKTTFNAGDLVPIFVDEALPGDTFNLKMTAFGRISTPVFPIMDNLYYDTFFFFVPCRLVWDHWENFNGAQSTPSDSTDYLIPQVQNVGMLSPISPIQGSLFDYMGLPTQLPWKSSTYPNGLSVNALPLRCYNLIYNTFFRDENLITNVPVVNMDDGPDAMSDYYLLQRGKRYDYFTSALPWPQKINDGTVVTIPLGTSAPVIATNSPALWFTDGTFQDPLYTAIGSPYPQWPSPDVPGTTGPLYFGKAADPTFTGLYTDLSLATAATINQLRQAFAMQKLFERDARGGTRYTEIIRSHFGVISPDARLQRPEYLGGGSSMINVTPVAQTSASAITGSITPQGNLSGFGTYVAHNHGFTKSFVEHGYIIGLCNVRADYTYQQGLNRFWSRSTRYDFYLPVFSHLGEQTILNKEIYFQGTTADNSVFGYQEAWADYRYKPSLITGSFRSNAAGPLDAWHLSQDFGSLPVLGASFIAENPPMDRILAAGSTATADFQQFLMDIYFQLHCARPMPVYGVPGMIDRF